MTLRSAILLALSCATHSSPPTADAADQPTHLCRTACGLISTDGDCIKLQTFEDEFCGVLPLAVPWDAGTMCGALRGWQLVIHKRVAGDEQCGLNGWVLYGSKDAGDLFCAGGYTHSVEHWIELPDTDWEHDALAHELIHALDFTLTGNVGAHCRFGTKLKTVLYALTGEWDPSKPGASCDAGMRDGGLSRP